MTNREQCLSPLPISLTPVEGYRSCASVVHLNRPGQNDGSRAYREG
jgi:hypothetical protein